MLRRLIAFPVLALVVVIQTAVISRITLLAGCADLMLVVLAAWALQDDPVSAWQWAVLGGVMVSFVSKLPWPIILASYLFIVFFAQILQRRVWQAPLLALFVVILISTFLMGFLTLLAFQLLGRPLPLSDTLGLIILPSLLLNLLFAIPVHTVIHDLAHWVNPVQEVE